MSIVSIKELDAISEPQAVGGVSVFGHAQVNEAVKIVSDALPQELRQFAEQLAKTNPDQAEQLCGLLIPLTTEEVIVTMTPERHKRIWHMIQSAMPVADEETELADERIVEQSNQTALADEEDYYGQRLPASAQ